MSEIPTRREFMQAATAVLAVAESAGPARAQAAPKSPRIALRRTTASEQYADLPPLEWRPAGKPAPGAIVLDPSHARQEILGFGAAFTDAACYTLSRLDAPAREHLLHDLFHPSGMNLSVCRTCMGSSDYSTEAYSYDEGEPDPEMQRFSIERDRAWILPVLR